MAKKIGVVELDEAELNEAQGAGLVVGPMGATNGAVRGEGERSMTAPEASDGVGVPIPGGHI